MRTSRFISAVLLIVSFTFLFQVSALAATVSPGLQATLQSSPPDQEVAVIITLSDRADLSRFKDHDKDVRRAKIVQALKDKADKTQGSLKAFLQGMKARRVKSFWVTNAIAARIPASLVNVLAGFPGVEAIETDAVVTVPPVAPSAAVMPLAVPAEWNIAKINAPSLWNAGITGTGAVVANVDTGVDPLHADLTGKWRGGLNSWYSVFTGGTCSITAKGCQISSDCPSGEVCNSNAVDCATPNKCTACELSATPCDMDGHGTGTMGVMVGGSAGGTAIGVAPDAKWIAVKIFNDSTSPSTPISLIGDAYTWLIGLPSGSAPDVINNSFGSSAGSCDTFLQSAITNLKTAGIELVFAAGNGGPNSSTSESPANNPGAFAVGATDNIDRAAGFSSRGPSACDGSIFPHVVAPGQYITLAALTQNGLFPLSYFYSNNGTMGPSGTSFSAPHVAGATALLVSALPSLTPDQIETAFEQTAVPLGSPIPNNTYGYGRIDVAAAYQYAFTNFVNGGNDPVVLVHDAAIVATYPDIQIALANCSNLDIIKVQAATPLAAPDINLPLGIAISLVGGYDSSFLSQTGSTTLQGTLIITAGTVIIANVIVG